MRHIDFFDRIDTEEKAYWLGFVWADGNIRKDYNALRVNLSDRDLDHLHKFALLFGVRVGVAKRHKNSVTVYAAVNCKSMCLTLAEKGVVPNKTKHDSRKAVDAVPKRLLHHFVRGFFDGDGCASGVAVGFVGGRKFLTALREVVTPHVGPGSLYNDGSVWRLKWNGARLKARWRKYLYRNATVCLERKRAAVMSGVATAPKVSPAKAARIRAACRSGKWSQTQIAKRYGISQVYVSNINTGRRLAA